MKVDVVNATTLNITSRGELGTPAVAHSAGTGKIQHSGQADGSCWGFPQKPDGSGCSSADSFDVDEEIELHFPNQQLTDGTKYLNGLNTMTHSPVKLDPGNSIGKRAGYSITFNDTQDNDALINPYPERRTSNGTLFKKLLSRHPYWENRRLIAYTGFSRDDAISREYLIDNAELSKGVLSVRAVDPLILTEEAKAKAPRASNGRLLAAINDSSTQITLKEFVVGEYGNDTDSVTVSIDDELIDCTVNDSANGILDIVTRGVGGSEQKDHQVNATVQYTLVWEDFNPVERIEWLLTNYTGVKASYLDDYTDVKNSVQPNMGKVYINKPTAVKKLIDEIISAWASSNLSVYWDERQQKIRIKSAQDFEQQPLTLTYEDNLKLESTNVKRDADKQWTRATIGFAPFNAGKKADDENSSIVFTSVGLDVELTGKLESNEKKELYTRLLTNSDNDVTIAVAGASSVVNTNKRIPEEWTFDIDYESYGQLADGVVEEGEIINVTSDEATNDDGTPVSRNLQILSMKDNPKQSTYTVTARLYQDVIAEEDFDFIIDEDKENYDLSTEYAPASAGTYRIFIATGVTIGATSTSNYAFTTGTQASGVEFEIVHRGQILGAGGAGANGPVLVIPSFADMPNTGQTVPGLQGSNGGNALNLTVPCEIDTTQGVIYAGGGGAPSTYSYAQNDPNIVVIGGNGGSGGQGYVGGAAGARGSAKVEPDTIDYGVAGNSGSRSAPGSLGGISAGAWGEGSESNASSGSASLGGYAILSNGNTVTIKGDNTLTIRGRRDF
jgi:hypothetical protein